MRSIRSRSVLVAALAAAAAGCSEPRTVDGTASECITCHGGEGDATGAPPHDVRGESDPALVTVGAHAAHVRGTHAIAAPLACDACHVTPTSVSSPGHVDASPAEVTFGALARTGGASPAWDRTAPTCTNVYCHGATLRGGAVATPVWNAAPAAGLGCSGCHGAPPAAPHPTRTDCASCHADTVDAAGAIRVAIGQHVDGKLELSGVVCTSCHGDPARAETLALVQAAPPVDTHGATSSAAVGTHLAHLHGGALSRPIACAECHVVPTQLAHADGTTQVAFGPLARTGGAVPTFGGGGCASTYCHGRFPGGSSATPAWTSTTALGCGSCHPATPTSGRHEKHRSEGVACGSCHPGYSSAAANAALHVNGTKDLAPAAGWDASRRSCTPACHGRESW